MKPGGVPDDTRAARIILKDFVSGKLLLCHAPPEQDQGINRTYLNYYIWVTYSNMCSAHYYLQKLAKLHLFLMFFRKLQRPIRKNDKTVTTGVQRSGRFNVRRIFSGTSNVRRGSYKGEQETWSNISGIEQSQSTRIKYKKAWQ